MFGHRPKTTRFLYCLLFCFFMLAMPALALSAEQVASVVPAAENAFETGASEFRVGQFVRLIASPIKAGATYTVTITGPSNYLAEFQSDNTGDGYLIMALPPCYNLSGNSLTSGDVRITIQGVAYADIRIAEPMTPAGIDPREFLAIGMEQFANDAQDAINGIASIDTSKASLQGMAEALAYNRDHLGAWAAQARAGSMPQGSGSSRLTLDASQIASSGRLLYSQMAGLLEMAGYDSSDFNTAAETDWPSWWRDTRTRLADAQHENRRIERLIESAQSASGVVGGIATLIGESNPMDEVEKYAPIILPLFNWTNQQYYACYQYIVVFIKGKMVKKDLAELDQRIGALQKIQDQVAGIINQLPGEVREFLDLETWLAKQRIGLDTIKGWREAMESGGGGGGGGSGTPLTNGFWRIDYSYSVTNDNGNYVYYDYHYIVTFDPNTGNVLRYGRSDDAVGTYSLNGDTITFNIDQHYNSPMCCFTSNDDRRVFTGTYRGGTNMEGDWTKEQPGDCGGNWSQGECYPLPTTTMGWIANNVGDSWEGHDD
jgi:hypothetical protein